MARPVPGSRRFAPCPRHDLADLELRRLRPAAGRPLGGAVPWAGYAALLAVAGWVAGAWIAAPVGRLLLATLASLRGLG